MKAIALLLLVVGPWTPAFAEAAAPRVAVVADEGGADMASQLIAELSCRPGVELVERDDLAKIGDERAVRELASRDGVGLGRLLHADGLAFVRVSYGRPEVRFTSTRLGLVLFDVAAAPDTDAAQTLQFLAGRIAGLAPKLALPPDRAIPLTLVNLRMDRPLKSGAEIERNLTLLLEKRLGAVPEFVVLERRHAGAVALERDLNPDAPTMAQAGQWWIDGTLSLPGGTDGKMTVALRLRSGAGKEAAETEVEGPASDPASLAALLADRIADALHGGKPDSTKMETTAEAREFLEEGLWAWKHEKFPEAAEALDSAELLGETASDLLAVRIRVLDALAVPRPASIPPRREEIPAEPRFEERVALIREAMRGVERYAAEDGEKHLQLSDSRHIVPGSTGDLRVRTLHAALALLWMLDLSGSSEADALRREVRTFAGYDPLHDGIPRDGWETVTYAETFAESTGEEAAYFHRLCARNDNGFSLGLWELRRLSPESYAVRLLNEPPARRKAFAAMLDELADDPATRPAGLFFRSVWGEPSARQRDFEAFLQCLWDNRQALLSARRLGIFLKYAFSDREKFPPGAYPLRTDLLHYYLQTETKWGDDSQETWHPELFTAAEAPGLWSDLEACKERCIPHGGGGTPYYFSRLESAYVAVFGAPASSVVPLTVRRFWPSRIIWSVLPADGASFWAVSGDGDDRRLVRLHTPELTGEAVAMPEGTGDFLAPSRHGLYILPMDMSGGRTQTPRLARYDPVAKTWETRDGTGISFLQEVGETLYYTYGSMIEHTIGRYDWPSGTRTVLASTVRRPALTPFDDPSAWEGIAPILSGPGGRPVLLTRRTVYWIDGPDAWSAALVPNDWYGAVPQGERTILFGPDQVGEQRTALALLDPARPGPEELIGVPAIFPVPAGRPGGPAAPAERPLWAAQPVWDDPHNRGSFVGLRGNDLVLLVQNGTPPNRFQVLYYRRGEKGPVSIPLRFEKPPSSDVATPESSTFQLRMTVAGGGICLRPVTGGLWFLPFSDIDAYLAEAKNPPVQP